MYLIVGLGNPGQEYAQTFHNLGFLVVEELGRRWLVSSYKAQSKALVASSVFSEHKIVLTKPQTYMNHSGLAVQELMSWFKIPPEKILIIYDDLDLEEGQIRLREKGSHGGHHGMESIIQAIGTTAFARLRIGIGKEAVGQDASQYVLSKIPAGRREVFDKAIVKAADAAECFIAQGIAAAMNKSNA